MLWKMMDFIHIAKRYKLGKTFFMAPMVVTDEKGKKAGVPVPLKDYEKMTTTINCKKDNLNNYIYLPNRYL